MTKVMRHRVSIYRKPISSSLDSRGQLTGSDVLLESSVPCLVEQLQANELIAARQQYASATHRVTMYRNSQVAVNEQHYITYGSRTLEIAGIIDPDGDDLKLVIVCGEKK